MSSRPPEPAMSFVRLILHNVAVKPLRLALTSLAVAIGVLTVVSLAVVTRSVETSALAILQTGKADFTVAQKGVNELLSSSVDSADLARIRTYPGVAGVTGVLIGTTKLNADNPLFLEIGISPTDLSAFGVNLLQGRPFDASATDQLILGWKAARNLGLTVGSRLTVDNVTYRVAGIYSTGQSLGDTGAMLPLIWFQNHQRQPNQYTLLFVRVRQGFSVPAVQATIDGDNPQLVAIRTAQEFGRADRSLSLIKAAESGSTVLAIAIGAVVVMSAMTMSFVERLREFGVLSSIGWRPRRILVMVLGEALVIGLIGAAGGTGLSVLAVTAIGRLPSLHGVLSPDYTAREFARALYTAAAMSLLGGLYPALRAALISPLAALRHE